MNAARRLVRSFPHNRQTLAYRSTTHVVTTGDCQRSMDSSARTGAAVQVQQAGFSSLSRNSSWQHGQQPLHRPQQQVPSFQMQQSRSIFIQSEETPNPESVKFIPTGVVVLPDGDINGYYVTKTDPMDSILRSPLAKDLFKIEGIKSVYLGADFVTITKFAQTPWKMLRPQILDVLMTFFDNDTPALRDQPEIIDTTILDDDDEVVAMIKELIESRIRPAVQEDGGDIRYVGFEEDTGIVTVELAGSCVGCPSSSVTLKQGVENMLQHYIPEITAVVALEEEPEGGSDDRSDAEAAYNNEDEAQKKQKTYEERLKAAGIPFSD